MVALFARRFFNKRNVLSLVCLSAAFLLSVASHADEQSTSSSYKRDEKINIAVAANFAKPLKSIAQQFTQLTGIDVAVTVSSSGTLYAQIQHGAGFDVFLSADRNRPQALVDNNIVHKNNLVDYAQGKLAFIYAGELPEYLNTQLTARLTEQLTQLTENPNNKIAIANPKLAPYGEAAKQTLQSLSLWQRILPHKVTGKNVLQTLQFYTTGSAQAAFVAYSLALELPNANLASGGSDKSISINNGVEKSVDNSIDSSAMVTTVIIPVPQSLHKPIIQSLVVNQKHAATLSPNLFDVQAEALGDVVEQPGVQTSGHVITQVPISFSLSDANGVSSASLFVQFLMSKSVQQSLTEWGYQPASTVGTTE